jgi:SAM-dependent methyltransferase
MEPVLVDGIPCYAPESARSHDGFPPERFDRLYGAETRNFWYRARARLIRRLVLERLAAGSAFIEIGCGTGSVLEALSGAGLELTGAEAYVDGLQRARRRLPSASFVQLDARRLPFRARFDGAGLFDVLEHVDDDEAVLREVREALKPGGWVFLTAPQHPWLWSANDEVALHRRRYRRGELADKARRAGFVVERQTSFVTTLLPVMAALRALKRRAPAGDPYEAVLRELELPAALNGALGAAMRLDEALIALGASLPAGGSVFVVARRP